MCLSAKSGEIGTIKHEKIKFRKERMYFDEEEPIEGIVLIGFLILVVTSELITFFQKLFRRKNGSPS